MDQDTNDASFTLPLPHRPATQPDNNPAAEIIRHKLDALYRNEPDAGEEVLQSYETTPRARSKHEAYMIEISGSGKSLAEIQMLWHDYYQGLSDAEKHEVWQEFYDQHARSRQQTPPTRPTVTTTPEVVTTASHEPTHVARNYEPEPTPVDQSTVSEIKKQLLSKVSANGRLKAKHHFQSLFFGLAMGAFVLFLFMFSFFNERFIAPFITPSKVVALPAIIDPSKDDAVDPSPIVYIPSINAVVPVVYTQTSNEEKAVQKSLEEGAVRLAGTANPGEKGNVVIVGHSSNNILNQGKFKFAFVNLRKVEVGELFYLHKDGKRYTYKVVSKKVVDPTDVSVLQPSDKPIATLITCDPPGTSLKRLVVVGEQIRPDPNANVAASNDTSPKPTVLPSNAPSLWDRLFN
jgi:LPXTG-site transpeptidase (sortase) family protein